MEGNIILSIFLPLALAVIMFGLGLSLTWADFRRVLDFPRAVVVGSVAQLIVLPALGFGVAAWLLPHNPELAIGLILLAMCPGGASANIVTHLAGGDTALCVTLTAISSIVKVFTIPLMVNYAIGLYMGGGTALHLDPLDSIVKIMLITIVPALLGMLARQRNAALAVRAERPVKIISAVFLVLAILAALIKERAHLGEYFAAVGLAALVLNLAGMLVGFSIPRLLRLPPKQQITISIETSIQNGTLAIAIASSPLMLGSSTMAIPAAVYGLIMYLTAFGFVWLMKRLHKLPSGVSA